MSLHISWSRVDAERRGVRFCPTCKRRRRMYGWYQDWYGWTVTCLGCGDRWCEGEMAERPFKPRWRPERIAEAKAGWDGMSVPFVDHHEPGWMDRL